MIIADTSALLAFFDASDHNHAQVSPVFQEGDIVVSPYVIAELDYLVSTHVGVDAAIAVAEELTRGGFDLASFGAEELLAAIPVVKKYRDLNPGLTDASLVVLAERYKTRIIATFDRRDFEAMRPIQGGRFKLLP